MKARRLSRHTLCTQHLLRARFTGLCMQAGTCHAGHVHAMLQTVPCNQHAIAMEVLQRSSACCGCMEVSTHLMHGQ